MQIKEKVRSTKGNIPINKKLLNKYPNVETIFHNEKRNYKINIIISNNIAELNGIDIKKINIEEAKKLAYKIFCNYHNRNTFVNDTNIINVSHLGIKESIEKAYYNRKQRDLLLEHLKIYSCLGKIIEEATLVNQVYERKGREKFNSWNYYLDGIIIDDKKYLIEFDVVSMINGKNNYRVQRLELL